MPYKPTGRPPGRPSAARLRQAADLYDAATAADREANASEDWHHNAMLRQQATQNRVKADELIRRELARFTGHDTNQTPTPAPRWRILRKR